MSEERASDLTLLSIENERAKNLDFKKVIQQFASAKARRKNFKFPTVEHNAIFRSISTLIFFFN